MHELSIALNLIELAEEESRRQGNATITKLYVRLGPLSGVVKESLQSAFQLAREYSPVENAELIIEDVPLVVYCPVCEADRPLPSIQPLRCPQCGTPTGQIVGGRELELVALEMGEPAF